MPFSYVPCTTLFTERAWTLRCSVPGGGRIIVTNDAGDPVRSLGGNRGHSRQNCRGNPDEEALHFASCPSLLSTGIAQMRASDTTLMSRLCRLIVPPSGMILSLSPGGLNLRQDMAKRKKRAATSRSSRKKRTPVKRRTTAKRRRTARQRTAAMRRTTSKRRTTRGAKRRPDAKRRASAGRASAAKRRPPRKRGAARTPVAEQEVTTPEEIQGRSPPPENTIATDEAQ